MKLRVARHTNDLSPLIQFYTEIIGMEILGEFKNHGKYNGVFIGLKEAPWHLEFTTSDTPTNHQSDEDDLLVFFVNTEEEFNKILAKADVIGVKQKKPANPYWESNGITLVDPDGFGVVISIRP